MSIADQGGVDDEFVRNITNCQNRLYVYILSLLPNPDRAKDVLQETNLLLWRKAAEFTPGTNFGAWACKIAYYEVLTERRKRQRDKHLFSEGIINLLASDAERRIAELDERSQALDECLERLPAKQRKRLLDRYSPGGSIQSIAEAAGESRGAIATALYRVRANLLECIQGKLARGIR